MAPPDPDLAGRGVNQSGQLISGRVPVSVASAGFVCPHLGIPQRLRRRMKIFDEGGAISAQAANASSFPFGSGAPQAPEQKERIVLR
jgi:hypothetical protein